MIKNLITEHGYTVEQSISGYWRLMKDGEVIYDDSACEELNEDKETAEDFFEEYLKENMKAHDVDYANYNVKVIEDSKYFHIDFRTGMGEVHYPKADWTLEDALKDQAEL